MRSTLSCTENGPKKSNDTLDEVRICFDKVTHDFTRCEEARDTCRTLKKVKVTPVEISWIVFESVWQSIFNSEPKRR